MPSLISIVIHSLKHSALSHIDPYGALGVVGLTVIALAMRFRPYRKHE